MPTNLVDSLVQCLGALEESEQRETTIVGHPCIFYEIDVTNCVTLRRRRDTYGGGVLQSSRVTQQRP